MTAQVSGGCTVVRESRARSTGTLIQVIDNRDGSFDADDPGWFNLCCTHASVVSHETRALATDFAAEPETWCKPCEYLAKVRDLRRKLPGIEPRHRLGAAISRVCVIGSPFYGPMVNQINALKDHPDRAREYAEFQLEFSHESHQERLDQVTAILAAVEGFELNDEWVRPGDVIPALTEYRDELARLMEE